ncbi:ribosome biogenesis GTPase Der [Pseudorhodoplanes sp.]|uniref:ribosome biogenesis GTPase Der n=1 Tax=Pseudorhodoplanes sp. TaxID=1934341 RepID=UPI002D10E541|nr:ribosome biogenesis GTPase Der [Pseudorhodoplanes sp.]HWV53023.1 ribosome biogenesis GTPase Der [Pseudorhodoplanes sp.]
MIPKVVIVGRPNVGKSTLFNRLVGRRQALVDDQPGVTRDRREGLGKLGDLSFTLVDTAGLEDAAPQSLAGRMLAQTKAAIADADAILFVVDARVGLLPADEGFADLVRKSGKSTILVANKSEGKAGAAGALEAYSLGLGVPIPVSAEHGEGLAELYDSLQSIFDRLQSSEPSDDDENNEVEDETEPRAARPIRVAVVGRPNAGKSTLVNRLLGEDRLLTGPEAGITRDTISVPLQWQGHNFLFHDTAGMRRKSRIEEKVEKLAVADALDAIRFADVVIVLMDAAHPFEEQDLRIADLVEREGRALVLGMNKWDLKGDARGTAGKLRGEADHWLPQVKGVPIVALSGQSGEGVDRLMRAVIEAHGVWNRRIATSELNRWFEETISAHPPPAVSGRRLKLNYITQPKTRPPSFVIFCTRADAVPDAYLRYLVNSLRDSFGLPGTPIRITLREKKNPYAGRAKPKH